MGKKDKEINKGVKIVNIVICIILIPVILINFAIIISTYINPDEIPGVLGIKPVAVLSGSMEDTFMSGDLIFIEKSNEVLKEGDVICYLVSNQAVTHRIMEITQDDQGKPLYTTKGDANNANDLEVVREEQIQGVWTGVRLKGLGDFAVFISSTTGMILFIVCPIILLIAWDMYHRWKLDKEEAVHRAKLEAELEELRALKNRQDELD